MNRIAAIIGVLAIGMASLASAGIQTADQILVKKSERKLYLFKNTRVLKTYDIALGLSPQGHKEREGDFRTPEGLYRLARRNPDSRFFLSIEISYPNAVDLERANGNGESPGGQIMIHGQPNEPKHLTEFYESQDWTDGCIAVSNADMIEIWLMTEPGTPIDIQP